MFELPLHPTSQTSGSQQYISLTPVTISPFSRWDEIANEKTDLNTTVEKLRELNRNYKARCESLARKNSEYEDRTEVNERDNRVLCFSRHNNSSIYSS